MPAPRIRRSTSLTSPRVTWSRCALSQQQAKSSACSQKGRAVPCVRCGEHHCCTFLEFAPTVAGLSGLLSGMRVKKGQTDTRHEHCSPQFVFNQLTHIRTLSPTDGHFYPCFRTYMYNVCMYMFIYLCIYWTVGDQGNAARSTLITVVTGVPLWVHCYCGARPSDPHREAAHTYIPTAQRRMRLCATRQVAQNDWLWWATVGYGGL